MVWIKSLATAAWCFFCSGSRSHRTNVAMTFFMSRSCVNISNTVVFGIPRSASSSHTVTYQPLLIAARTCSIFSGVLLVAGLPECGSLSRFFSIFEAFMPQIHLYCTHCIISESFLNHPNSFQGGMFKLNTKFDADSLLYLLSHFECDSHTVHMLTQWFWPPPTD